MVTGRFTRLLLNAVLLCALGCGDWPPSRFLIPESRRPNVAEAAFRDEQGRRFALSEFRGKVVLLQLWSPRVPVSRDVLIEIMELQRQPDSRCEVLAVSMDPGGFQEVRDFLAQHPGWALKVVIPDGSGAMAPFGNWSALPSTLVVDRQGRLRERWNGHLHDRAARALRTALKEP